jgi:hypothetical protein
MAPGGHDQVADQGILGIIVDAEIGPGVGKRQRLLLRLRQQDQWHGAISGMWA